MDFYYGHFGFGMALAQNQAAMIRYAHLDEKSKRDILERAHHMRSEEDMHTLVASLTEDTAE